jgi:hypothetical protein
MRQSQVVHEFISYHIHIYLLHKKSDEWSVTGLCLCPALIIHTHCIRNESSVSYRLCFRSCKAISYVVRLERVQVSHLLIQVSPSACGNSANTDRRTILSSINSKAKVLATSNGLTSVPNVRARSRGARPNTTSHRSRTRQMQTRKSLKVTTRNPTKSLSTSPSYQAHKHHRESITFSTFPASQMTSMHPTATAEPPEKNQVHMHICTITTFSTTHANQYPQW